MKSDVSRMGSAKAYSMEDGKRRARGPLMRGARAGFTLAELAMAAGVLALALVSIIPVMQRAFKHQDAARCVTIAGSIMQTELEKERLMDWSTVSNPSYSPSIDSSFTSVPSIAGRFTLSRSLAVLPNRSDEMVQVTLTVSWSDGDGRNLSRTLTSYFGKNGLRDFLHDKS